MRELTPRDMTATAITGKHPGLIVHNPAPFNAEPPAEVLAGTEITPIAAFYCRNHGAIPDLDPAQWRLRVDVAGTTPLTLTYRQLTEEFTGHEVTATLQCAGNRRAELLAVRPMPGKEPWRGGAISTAVWRGARLADVLGAAGLDALADLSDRAGQGSHVALIGADTDAGPRDGEPYGSSIPLAKAAADEVLLAWQMNGHALPALHGGPVRLVVPGYIGARSVKWVTGISVQPQPSQNYFQSVDYRMLPADAMPAPNAGIALSELALNCDILSPADGAALPSGAIRVRGYAIGSDTARIARVEVSPDDGANWLPADLAPARSRWAWRPWSILLPDTGIGGARTLLARAWSDTGTTHPEHAAALWNPGGYLNNSWGRVRVRVGPG